MIRDELYRKFGPIELEAVVRLLFSEINILRVKNGLPERTPQQAIDALENQILTLTKYDWMG